MMEKEKISLLQRFIIWRENKIKEKMNLLPGAQVTDLMKSNLKMQIEKYLKEKGYYNTNIRIIQR